MVLLRGNNLCRCTHRSDDIEGAQSRPYRNIRMRSVPLDPLNPAYQPIEPEPGPAEDWLVEARQPAAPPRVPSTQISELFESQGSLSMHGRRTRKDFRKTNDISDIEQAAPRPLLGRNGEGRIVSELRDGLATWKPESEAPAPAPLPPPPPPQQQQQPPLRQPMSHKERLAAQLLATGFSPAEAQRILRRAQATGFRSSASEGSMVPRRGLGKKTFTDTAYETHLETHIDFPGISLVHRPVGRETMPPAQADDKSHAQRRLERSRQEQAQDEARAAAAEEAKARTLARGMRLQSETASSLATTEWKQWVGNSLPTSKPPPANLQPPPEDSSRLLRSMSTADVDGARPRGYVPAGEFGGRRPRRQYRVTNWTIDEPRRFGAAPRGGPLKPGLEDQAPMGVGMWYTPTVPVRQQPRPGLGEGGGANATH